MYITLKDPNNNINTEVIDTEELRSFSKDDNESKGSPADMFYINFYFTYVSEYSRWRFEDKNERDNVFNIIKKKLGVCEIGVDDIHI